MPKRDFLKVSDFSAQEIEKLLELAAAMKSGQYDKKPLAGKTLAMVFTKSSTRTRVSFEVGAYQLGGNALFLSSRDLQLGRGEPIKDTARVLSRYVDGIMIRTFAHADVEELAHYSTVPVINGLTDFLHPCQALADVMTVREAFGTWEGKVVVWIGDGNNVANSWLNAAGVLGFELRLACPEGFEPNHDVYERADGVTTVSIHEDPEEAIQGAHVVNTDVWASMGQEGEADARKLAFKGYTVDESMMKLAAPDAIFLHCLPAHRGEEVTDEVIEGPQSRVFDQAENRLHAQRALMAVLMGGESVE
jgi:ornithine carbamoyltransferase